MPINSFALPLTFLNRPGVGTLRELFPDEGKVSKLIKLARDRIFAQICLGISSYIVLGIGRG